MIASSSAVLAWSRAPVPRGSRLGERLKHLARADVALSAAGGYLFSPKAGNLTLRHVLVEMAAASRTVPTILLPQSIGPITGSRDRRRFSRVLGRLGHILVREASSYRVATRDLEIPKDRVSQTPDLAFALARSHPRRRPCGRTRVGMTVLDWRWAGGSSAQYERYLVVLAEIADRLLARDYDLDLLVQVDLEGHARQDDRRESERVRSLVRRNGRVTVEAVGRSPQEALDRYGSYDLVIGSRLHSALLALCAGTPAIALGYQPKAVGIYEQLGLAPWVFDARQVQADAVLRTAEGILGNHDSAAADVLRSTARAKASLQESVAKALSPWLGPAEASYSTCSNQASRSVGSDSDRRRR